MTEEQILEGNKLIAEYMGWELININDEPADPDFDCWVFRNKITGQSDSGVDAQIYNKNSTLPFNEDWNLLMPVVHKCCQDLRDKGFNKRGDWTPELGYVSEIYVMRLNNPIEKVWEEVVNHVKRYKK